MSVEAITWALNEAPVDSSPARFVLVGLANHAGPDGRAAFPSIERLCRYTALSERTVRAKLRELEELGLIVRGNPAAAAAHIARADRRPTVYDLRLDLVTDEGRELPPVAEPGDKPGDTGDNGGHEPPPVEATGGTSPRHGGRELPPNRP